jgi:hypothetical protein
MKAAIHKPQATGLPVSSGNIDLAMSVVISDNCRENGVTVN